MSPAAEAWVADAGYSAEYGARPLKRLIQASILNPLATLLLEDRIQPGARIFIGVHGEGVPGAASAKPLHVDIAAGSDPSLSQLRFWVV